MTKEQERSVEKRNTEERLQDLIDDIRRNKIKACELISEEGKYNLADDIETVLNMLKEKDREIKQKDKQIDLMAEYIDGDDTSLANYLYRKNGKCNKEMIKQYFKEIAERKSEE